MLFGITYGLRYGFSGGLIKERFSPWLMVIVGYKITVYNWESPIIIEIRLLGWKLHYMMANGYLFFNGE